MKSTKEDLVYSIQSRRLTELVMVSSSAIEIAKLTKSVTPYFKIENQPSDNEFNVLLDMSTDLVVVFTRIPSLDTS